VEQLSQRDADIIAAIEAGELFAVIGERVGLTKHGVKWVATKYGVTSPLRKIPVTGAERAAILRQFDAGVPMARIKSKRRSNTVREVLIRAGRRKPTPPSDFWKERGRVATLKRLWGKVSCDDLAARIGTTKNAVIGKAARLGLPRLQPATRGGA
jgi:hypothetical protein